MTVYESSASLYETPQRGHFCLYIYIYIYIYKICTPLEHTIPLLSLPAFNVQLPTSFAANSERFLHFHVHICEDKGGVLVNWSWIKGNETAHSCTAPCYSQMKLSSVGDDARVPLSIPTSSIHRFLCRTGSSLSFEYNPARKFLLFLSFCLVLPSVVLDCLNFSFGR
jgi:hypothetical protein